tara:strand:- start:292 stop:1710 length:1419 start_codon:yes stop_codon:yes gene_type:complete
MGQCYLKLYDHFNYQGHLATFTESAYNGHPNSNDRDASGTVTGDCKNTTWLGFEHPGEGGHAWIMGEGGSLPNFKDAYDKCNVKDRKIWKFHDQNNSIKRIDIPTENINEGRLREDITIYAKRRDTRNCEWATYPKITKTSDGKYNANDSDQWLDGHNDKKGKACPGGDAYWKGYRKISCVYKGADQIKALSQAVKGADSNKDPRVVMYDNIAKKFCSKAENLNTIVTHDNKTCTQYDTSKALAKQWCQRDHNIVDDTLNLCTSAHLGADMYNTLAEEYCKTHPDAEFCKCYNVVNYETICANRGTSKGCPAAKEAYDKYVQYEVPDPLVWLPCGDACKGANVYQPPGYKDGCDGTINACIQKIDVGASHDEINAVCNIDSGAESELTDGGSGGSGSSDGSDGSGSVSTSAVEELKKTIAEDKKKEEEEAKKTKKKLLIGGGGGGIVSSISFLMLIVLIIMTMSKKGGGGRR